MNIYTVLLILLVAALAPSCALSSNKTHLNDPCFNSVCTADDRDPRICTLFEIKGCICYNNGTCVNTEVNKCFDCSREDVFAVLEGKSCPDMHPYLCQPPLPAVEFMCLDGTYEACVCTQDGKCAEQPANKCIDCQEPNILAVFNTTKCPAQNLKTSKYFIPARCANIFKAGVVKCSSQPVSGCVCFNNGTCEYRSDGNKCQWCVNSNVTSFTEDQKCPELGVLKLYSCDIDNRPEFCTMIFPPIGCLCYLDGTCAEGHVDYCQGCRIEDAVSVLENGACSFLNLSE